jgi:hypothetical protein
LLLGKRLAKLKLAFNQICNDLLSSGNIYWQRSSGAEVLISSKGDILNLEMVNKLEKLKQQMLIEDAIDFTVQEVLLSKFEAYETETDFKQKMKLRKEFNMHLTNYFLYSSKTQFEMNQLCWKLFSEIKTDVGASFLNRDRDYFKRSTSIASSMVLIAFLIGYYDPKFLRDLYSSTITNQMMMTVSLFP